MNKEDYCCDLFQEKENQGVFKLHLTAHYIQHPEQENERGNYIVFCPFCGKKQNVQYSENEARWTKRLEVERALSTVEQALKETGVINAIRRQNEKR